MNIIGAGPVGLYAAYLAAKKGFPVTVHEEHRKIGKPEHCTGIISRNLWKFVKPDSGVIMETLKGAHFYAGDEHAFIERKNDVDVLNRTALDHQIGEMAKSEGAKIRTGHFVSWKDFSGDIVAADGVISRTRMDFGQKLETLPALQYDLKENASELEGSCELWYGTRTPNFFTWVVPRGKGVRVGMAGRDLRSLKNFVLKRFGRFRKTAQNAGLVITGGPTKKNFFEINGRKIALVGDAAGHVKPTTGGGVVFGLRGAKNLIDSLPLLKNYPKKVNKDFGRELQLQKMAQKLILRNPEAFVRFLSRSKGEIERVADMEEQSRVIWKTLPNAIRFLFGL